MAPKYMESSGRPTNGSQNGLQGCLADNRLPSTCKALQDWAMNRQSHSFQSVNFTETNQL